MNIVLLATAWGPRYGGINAFNQDFAVGLATALSESDRVFCAVLDPTDADLADAARQRVTLIPVESKQSADRFDISWSYDILIWLKRHQGTPQIDWWVGHDLTSGEAALAAAQIASGGAALIMHMSYIDYQAPKHDCAAGADAKHRQQKKLFRNKCARLFAVGPLLRDAGEELAGRKVEMLVPGFPRLPALPRPTRSIVAITFGRMDRASDRIKQARLAIAGFGEALKAEADYPFRIASLAMPRMYLIGLSGENEEAEAYVIADGCAGRMVNLLPLPYGEDRALLFEHLAGANLGLMLSWHEGFGLCGWEAIAAELPLIVGMNSGLYQLIDETLGGSGTGCLLPIRIEGARGADGSPDHTAGDSARVSQAIQRVAAGLDRHLRDAKNLKRLLLQELGCTWEHTARQFLKGLGHG